jgi:hypothetical protein
MVQSILNNSLSTRLNKRTPMQVFTGHGQTTPLALMLKDNVPVNAPLDFIKAQKLMEVEKLSKAMTEIHTVAELPSGILRACRGTPQERCSPARTNVVVVIMSKITVVSFVSSFSFFIIHDVLTSRHLHIRMLRNDYTVPTRC